MLISLAGDGCTNALLFYFPTSNNEAEYETLITRLNIAQNIGIQNLREYSDSQLMVRQVSGEYETRDSNLSKYVIRIHDMIRIFQSFDIYCISRFQNKRADALSKLVLFVFTSFMRSVL